MRSAWSLVCCGIMPAAKVGCKGSCTRSKSQADKGETTRAESPAWSMVMWILCRKGNFNPGPPESSIGIDLPESLGCQPSKQSKPSRKTTPTLLQPHIGNATAWLHAPIMLPFNVWRRGKSLCCSSIEYDYHLPSAGFFLVHRISRAIYFFQQILTFALLWTAFSSAKTGSPSFM